MGAALLIVPALAVAWVWAAPGRRPPRARRSGGPLAPAERSRGRLALAERSSGRPAVAERSGGRPAFSDRLRALAQLLLASRALGDRLRALRQLLLAGLGDRLRALRQLLLAGLVMAVVGLAWPVLMWLTPASDRPWISGTSDNDIWSLILGYNGLGRLVGQSGGPGGGVGGAGGGPFGGSPGVLRLLNESLGGQAGWFLGAAVVAAVGIAVASRLRRGDARTGWVIAVGGLFATIGVAFSTAKGIFHPYYTSQLAPFAAALVGAGAGSLVRGGRRAAVVGTLGIAAAVACEIVIFQRSGADGWLAPLVTVGGAVAAGVLVFGVRGRARTVLVAAVVALLLVAPAEWAVETLGHGESGPFPSGGAVSQSMGLPGGGPGGGAAALPGDGASRGGGGAAAVLGNGASRAGGGAAALPGNGASPPAAASPAGRPAAALAATARRSARRSHTRRRTARARWRSRASRAPRRRSSRATQASQASAASPGARARSPPRGLPTPCSPARSAGRWPTPEAGSTPPPTAERARSGRWRR